MTTHNDRMARVIKLYESLVRLGEPIAPQLDLDLIQVLYEQSDAERWAVEDMVARYQELRASYVTVGDVAKQWRISERQVRRLAQAGALKGSRRRGRWQFTPQAITRYVAAHTYNGMVRVAIPPGPADATPDADLLARARANVEDMPWRVYDLAGVLEISQDRAYRLVLGWYSAGAVERTRPRGYYRFTKADHKGITAQ